MLIKKKKMITYSLEDLLTSINVLKNLTSDPDVRSKLNKYYDELRFAKPSKNDKVLLINNQIEHKFDELRIKIAHNEIDEALAGCDEIDTLLIKRKGACNELNNEKRFKLFKRKKKLAKLERTEVTDQILSLERRQAELVKKIENTELETKELFEKGKKEKNLQMRTFYAKRIESINREKEANIKRATLINYKVGLLNRLKDAIDDRDFFYDKEETSVIGLLEDDKQLTKFLTSIKTKQETVEEKMINIEAKFTDYDQANIESDAIYGSHQSTDDILAQMEMQAQFDDEEKMFNGLALSIDELNKVEV